MFLFRLIYCDVLSNGVEVFRFFFINLLFISSLLQFYSPRRPSHCSVALSHRAHRPLIIIVATMLWGNFERTLQNNVEKSCFQLKPNWIQNRYYRCFDFKMIFSWFVDQTLVIKSHYRQTISVI